MNGTDIQIPLRRQELIADLGRQALETEDLDRLMYDATVVIVEALDAEYCKVLELLPNGEALLLRQGVGWNDGIVGSATAPTDRDSQAGYTLLTEQPVIVDDLRTEYRFSGPELLSSHDVISGVSVIIGSVTDPWGVLGVHTTDQREFTEADAIFIKNISNILASAIKANEANERLEQTLDLFRKTERTANVGGWEIDPETMDVFWTDHLFEILGIPGDEAPPIEDALDVYHKADLPVVRRAIESALSSGEPFDIEVRFWRADDELRWLHILGVPETEDGDVVSLRGAAQDITERKTYQHELEASHERLEQFASTVSHDLKKPLSTVTSYLQLLERRYKDELDDDAEEFIDIAVGSTMRMRELLDGITTEYTNIDAEMDSLQPVDLDTVLEGVLIDLKTKIDRNDAEITVDSLPRVEGEATQFYQLFLNLIDNAIKYSGEEPPKIEISANRGDEMWVISIRDEGIGIDTDDHDFVFDVFHRLHDDERIPGTGIGLTLCKRIVERHDGDICIESELGEGSTVSFTLPPADDRTVE